MDVPGGILNRTRIATVATAGVVAALALMAPRAKAQDTGTTTTTTDPCPAGTTLLPDGTCCTPDPTVDPGSGDTTGTTTTGDTPPPPCPPPPKGGDYGSGGGGNHLQRSIHDGASSSSGSSGGSSAGTTGSPTDTTTQGRSHHSAKRPSKTRREGERAGHFKGRIGALGQLPEPLPPGKRLDPSFANALKRIAHHHDVNWAVLLAVVRVQGGNGSAPASNDELRALANRLSSLTDDSLRGRDRRLSPIRALLLGPSRTKRAIDLADYGRAVGLRGLVEGLDAVKAELGRRALESPRLAIYAGGRGDIAAGKIDVRVLTVMLYLSQRWNPVTVSALISGHSTYVAGTHRVSLHAYGRAVDISALGGIPILGHQNPGGITERALRKVLSLPAPLQPSELISLFDLGGPSFALPDHADHIHVGF